MRLMDTFKVIKTLFARQRGAVTRDGHLLSERDSDTVRDAFLAFICLCVDLNILDLEGRRAQTGRVISEFLRCDLIVSLKALASIYELVQHNCQDRERFKAALAFSPSLAKALEVVIATHCLGDLPSSAKLLQIGAFMSRLSLADIDLTDESIEDYLESERLIPEEFPRSIVASLRRIISFWCRDFRIEDICFRHGNGAVAFCESKTLEVKYRSLGTDALIASAFRDLYQPSVETFLSPSSETLQVIDRISETTFVPKSWKSMRTISMESPTLMYLQQGILEAIDKMVERSTYLRDRIGTHEQERNVRLAQMASLYRDFATIDLSAASDSVPWSLTKELFRNTPLYPFLLATRSRETLLPNGKIVQLRKFAPMGSALCFPIETMIFASICELVTRRKHRESGGSQLIRGSFSVYGDDIICPTSCAEDVIDVLSQLGFRVNNSKSFWKDSDWYRESCGGEFINGFDVTPLRLSRKFSSEYTTSYIRERETSLETGNGVAGYVDAYNAAFEKGFMLVRCFFKDKLDQHGFVPFYGHGGLRGFSETNYHLQKKKASTRAHGKRPNLQLDRYLISRFVPVRNEDQSRGDEAIAYRHWLEQAARRQLSQARQSKATVIRWVPLYRNDEHGARVFLGFQALTIDRTSIIESRVGSPVRRSMKTKWCALPRT